MASGDLKGEDTRLRTDSGSDASVCTAPLWATCHYAFRLERLPDRPSWPYRLVALALLHQRVPINQFGDKRASDTRNDLAIGAAADYQRQQWTNRTTGSNGQWASRRRGQVNAAEDIFSTKVGAVQLAFS